jgi:hypothetical protein
MNYKYTKTPEEYAGFFFAENKVTHPEYSYIIHLGFPQFMLKWKESDGYFSDYKTFFKSIVEIQWISGVRPSQSEEKAILTKAWKYLCIEDRILEDDMDEIEDDDDY